MEDNIYQMPVEPVQIKKPRRIFRKIILVLAILLALLGLIYSFYPQILSLLWGGDIPAPNTDDLKLETILVPENDNSYYDLLPLIPLLDGSGGSDPMIAYANDILIGSRSWDKTYVENLLSQDSQVLEYFDSAARKSKFQDPYYANSKAFNVTPQTSGRPRQFALVRRVAQVVSVRSEYLSRQGKYQEAMDEAIKLLKIGRQLEDSQSDLVTLLVGYDVKNMGCRRIIQLSQFINIPSDLLVYYANELDKYRAKPENFKRVLIGEYLGYAYTIDTLAQGNIEEVGWGADPDEGEGGMIASNKIKQLVGSRFYFKPNKTKEMFASATRTEISNAFKLYGDIEGIDIKAIPVEYPLILITENVIGKLLYSLMGSSHELAIYKMHELNFELEAVKTILALKAYKQSNGDLPESLSDLVPKYLNSVPKDPIDGKDIKYSKSKKIVYSVGQDLKNTGGSDIDPLTDSKYIASMRKIGDPSFKIKF